MIQRTDRFDANTESMETVAKPVTVGTGRALLQNNNNDSAQTCLAALSTARKSLQTQPQIVHCTFSPEFDAHLVAQTLHQEIKVPVLGRSVNKKESTGVIEILILAGTEDNKISSATGTVDVAELSDSSAKSAAVTVANKALDGLVSRDSCAFLVFCHTPGEDAAVRAGLDEACPGVIAYGGSAKGDDIVADNWALLGSGVVQTASNGVSKTVHVAAIPGSVSFFFSAVIKNWVEPSYTEALSLMVPSYVGNPQLDLLTAIRYDDWKKFLWCIEQQNIDVNTKWTSKQNQSPLLAACSRARTEMIKYLLAHGADAEHRNDAGYTASMYTRKLTGYDRDVIMNQLKMLQDAGANVQLMEHEREMLLKRGGKFVE